MNEPISITLSDNLSTRVRYLAQQRHADIITVVEQLLDEALPIDYEESAWSDLSEPDEAADREMEAYLALHAELKKEYFGKYVAIHKAVLIDHDSNFDLLYDRIEQAYPSQFVWISKVEDEPVDTFTIRSPHFDLDE